MKGGVFSIIVAVASQPAAAKAPVIPVEAFAQLSFLSDPVLSPDGRRIVAKVSAGGEDKVAIYDLSSAQPTEPVSFSLGDRASLRSLA